MLVVNNVFSKPRGPIPAVAEGVASVSRGLLLPEHLKMHSNAAPPVADEFEAASARPSASRDVVRTASEAADEVVVSRGDTAVERAKHAAEPRHA